MLDRNYQTGLFIVRPKFQKSSALKFIGRTIPHSGKVHGNMQVELSCTSMDIRPRNGVDTRDYNH